MEHNNNRSNHKKKSNDYQILPAFDDDGNKVDFMEFLRVEFQDGTSKLPTQDYHGSGRPHTINCTRLVTKEGPPSIDRKEPMTIKRICTALLIRRKKGGRRHRSLPM